MELRQYLAMLRKWAWLLVLTTAIAAASSYLFSRMIRPTYRAETTMLVGRVLDTPNPNPYDPQNTINLAQAYALLVTQPPILQSTAEAVHWLDAWQELYFKITATTPSSQLLRIGVADNDPEMAKAIADELAHQLVLQGPVSSQQSQMEEQRTFVSSQLAQLKLQIETAQKTLNGLTNQAALENDANKLNDLNARISALQTKIADWQKNYASLSALLTTGSGLFVTILAPAQVPATPISPNIPQNVFIAALAGLVLAGGAMLLLEYLDDTVKSPDDVQKILNVPALGAITRIAGIHDPADNLITLRHPRSPISEAYRVFRTNLRFTGIEKPSGALLITSSAPGEGKTTTAANLAVIMAQAGRRVVLIDTDMRRPSVHRLFGLSNAVGLSNLFLGDAPSLESIMQSTQVPGLGVITSGPLPPNPAEILDSKLMTEILSSLKTHSDILILDSPPTLAVADASILAMHCSGVVVVIDSGRTRTDACRRTFQTLQQTGGKVFGVVLNKLSTRRSGGSYSYYYYYSEDKKKKKAGTKRPADQPTT